MEKTIGNVEKRPVQSTKKTIFFILTLNTSEYYFECIFICIHRQRKHHYKTNLKPIKPSFHPSTQNLKHSIFFIIRSRLYYVFAQKNSWDLNKT